MGPNLIYTQNKLELYFFGSNKLQCVLNIITLIDTHTSFGTKVSGQLLYARKNSHFFSFVPYRITVGNLG